MADPTLVLVAGPAQADLLLNFTAGGFIYIATVNVLMQAAASSGDELAKLVVDLGLAPSTYAAGNSWIMNEGGTSLQDIIDANLTAEFASSLGLGRLGAYKLRVRLEALGTADRQEVK